MAQGNHYQAAKSVLVYVAIFALVTPSAEADQTVDGSPVDPFLDPKDDPYNPLKYIPSNALTAIALVFITLTAFIQTFYTFRYGAKWMFSMVIGGYTYAIGFGCRFGLHYHLDSKEIYITEHLFILLSPCAFITVVYVLLGRLARHISCTTHLLLSARKLILVFVSSDIMTFLFQVFGKGMTAASDEEWQIGSHLLLAGVVLQSVSFTLFSGLYTHFLCRVYALEHDTWEQDRGKPWYRDWRTLATALAISCIGILVRSYYRVAEVVQGVEGYLATTEAFFYVLDTLPIFVAISMYTLFWPGWFINGATTGHEELKLFKSP